MKHDGLPRAAQGAPPSGARRSSLGILFLIVFSDLLGFGIVIPLLPRYGEVFGASPAVLGALLACYSLLQFIFSPIWGRLSDRFGRKPILVLSLAGSALGYLLFASARSIPVLILSRALAGVMAANISTAQAYIADVTTPEKRARGMGLIGAAFGLGFSLGPFVGGFLASLQETSVVTGLAKSTPVLGGILRNVQGLPGLFAALLSATALILTITLLPESLRGEQRTASSRSGRVRLILATFQRPQIGIVLLLFFIYTFGFTQVEMTLAQLMGHRFGFDISRSYWLFGWIGVIAALVQGGLIGPLARWLGERALAAAGILTVTVSLFVLPFVSGTPSLMAALALLAIGAGLANPSLSALVSRLTPASEQGSALGVFQSMSSIARIIGPIVAQLLYQKGAHVHAPLLVGAAFGLLGFILSLRLLIRPLSSPEAVAEPAGGGH